MLKSLSRPPIKEAILEILCEFPDSSNINFLKSYSSRISSRYPKRTEIVVISENEQSETSSITLSKVKIGFQNTSADGNSAVQLRNNGFSYSLLNETYTTWEHFFPIAAKELIEYFEYVNVTKVLRASLRFINEINIPQDRQLSEFLTVLPNLGNITTPISNFILKTELYDEQIQATAILTELLSRHSGPEIKVFFDIDVRINQFDTTEVWRLENLEPIFNSLRVFKNQIFFSSLTEEALNRYN